MALSKKLRFEVFKRDSFTCQYCGRKAPDIILEVDHIQPVAKDGKDTITNLITSCFECNRGKGDRTLKDDTVLSKKRQQLQSLQERKEQIEMMCEWELSNFDDKQPQVKTICKIWKKLTDSNVTESRSSCKRDKV